MCIIHRGMAYAITHWDLYNHAIDYMSQYVDWTATPVSMWIYGDVWECEWRWCVDKVVVLYLSIIRLVHTQKTFAPKWQHYWGVNCVNDWTSTLANCIRRSLDKRSQDTPVVFRQQRVLEQPLSVRRVCWRRQQLHLQLPGRLHGNQLRHR